MKKVLIVAVCLALVLTLAFTLGASSGKKPEKPPPGKPEHVIYKLTFEEGLDVTGTIEECVSRKGLVDTYEKPVPLELNTEKFGLPEYNPESGVYFQLTEHKGTITMGYWFWYPDKVTGEKLMLEVEGETPDDWLSLEEEFTVEFTDATARITGKANRVIWPENGEVGTVSIVVTCTPQQQEP